MKFVVSRASSGLLQREKPCQEASPATLTYIIRGTEGATLEDKRRAWILIIRNLDELMKFVKKQTELHHSVIIEESDYEELEYEIIIQDEPF